LLQPYCNAVAYRTLRPILRLLQPLVPVVQVALLSSFAAMWKLRCIPRSAYRNTKDSAFRVSSDACAREAA
jgi:hypothetical protein